MLVRPLAIASRRRAAAYPNRRVQRASRTPGRVRIRRGGKPPGRCQRLLRILVESHMPVRMLEMKWVYRGIAQAEQSLPRGADGDGPVSRCVAGYGKNPNPRHNLVLAINQDDLIAHRLEASAGDFTCHVFHQWPGRV